MEGKKLAGTILSVSCRTLIFVLVALALYFVGRTAYTFGNDVFNEHAMTSVGNAYEADIVIQENYTVSSVGQQLVDAGLIENSTVFWVQAKLSGNYNKFTPGTYTLNSTMTPSEIIAAISIVPKDTED